MSDRNRLNNTINRKASLGIRYVGNFVLLIMGNSFLSSTKPLWLGGTNAP